METKYTPGSWHVNPIPRGRMIGDGTAKGFQKLLISGANCTIATVYHVEDARLIAAAPELLAAAQFALDMPDGVPVTEWNEARAKLRAAIVKSKGE